MLAVHRAMAQQYPNAFNGPVLVRQPSAEDIDAAHQLLSSARGERPGAYSNPVPPSNTAQRIPTPSEPCSPELRNGQSPAPTATDISNFAQQCRYVVTDNRAWLFS